MTSFNSSGTYEIGVSLVKRLVAESSLLRKLIVGSAYRESNPWGAANSIKSVRG